MDAPKLPNIDQLMTKITIMLAQGYNQLSKAHPLRLELEQIEKLCNDLTKPSENKPNNQAIVCQKKKKT